MRTLVVAGALLLAAALPAAYAADAKGDPVAQSARQAAAIGGLHRGCHPDAAKCPGQPLAAERLATVGPVQGTFCPKAYPLHRDVRRQC